MKLASVITLVDDNDRIITFSMMLIGRGEAWDAYIKARISAVTSRIVYEEWCEATGSKAVLDYLQKPVMALGDSRIASETQRLREMAETHNKVVRGMAVHYAKQIAPNPKIHWYVH